MLALEYEDPMIFGAQREFILTMCSNSRRKISIFSIAWVFEDEAQFGGGEFHRV